MNQPQPLDQREAKILANLSEAWLTWTSRPDNPAEFDQQTAFINSRDRVAFLMGGNGSGKSASAAFKCAKFLLSTPAPRPDTPFWIIAQNYDQVCSVCWAEKLWGCGFLPKHVIDMPRIAWVKPNLNWPRAVPLKKDRNGNNWLIEFKTYEQGRAAMQARSIGGAWFSEQVDWSIFLEVLRGCRDYMFPGGLFLEFTPIEPELCIAIEKYLDDPPEGWGFYRCNTRLNTAVSEEWKKTFESATPDEMIATRFTGALATFEGVIYPSFQPAVHVTSDDTPVWTPGTTHYRGIDWGASAEHPFVCVWACEDAAGDWLVYDEYWENSQNRVLQDHIIEILARSAAWGWPDPEWLTQVESPNPNDRRLLQLLDSRMNRDAEAMHKTRLATSEAIRRRMAELAKTGLATQYNRVYGDTYADPSRPDGLNSMNLWGVTCMPAANDVYKGIDTMRRMLKVNPVSEQPRLRFAARCKHSIEEYRKYRWVKPRPNGLWSTSLPKPVPLKKDDDTCDAGRYLIHTVESRRGLQPATTSSSHPVDRRPDVPLDRPQAGRGVIRTGDAVKQGFFVRANR